MGTDSNTQAAQIPLNNGREILRFFSPRWFIAIMATGAVANVLQLISGSATGALHSAAVALLTLAIVAFPIAFVLLASRLFIDRQMLVRELEHSSLVQFYSGLFIAAAICTTGLVKIPQELLSPDATLALAKAFWSVSLFFGLTLAIFTPWRIITLNHGEIRRILGFWFLPPVGLFVLVFAGNFLALKTGDAAWIDNMALLNVVLLGAAIAQSVMIFTMFLLRSLALPFPPTMDVIPSFTIGLAPVGVSIIALLSYLPLMEKAASMSFVPVAAIAPLVKLLALLLWGFGFWWMIVALLITLTAFSRKAIPVTLGYWAFIFPPAAYTIATLTIGQLSQLGFVKNAGLVLGALVSAGWLIVAILTLRGIFNRSIFKLPPSFSEILQDIPGTAALDKDLTKSNFQGKFPIFSVDMPKNASYRELGSLAAALKAKIGSHPVARHVADFDHHAHTKGLGGEMPAGLRNAMNIVFCFGPKIEEARVIAVRPRSFGIAEFDNHFTISFMEAPSDKATDTMKEWVKSL